MLILHFFTRKQLTLKNGSNYQRSRTMQTVRQRLHETCEKMHETRQKRFCFYFCLLFFGITLFILLKFLAISSRVFVTSFLVASFLDIKENLNFVNSVHIYCFNFFSQLVGFFLSFCFENSFTTSFVEAQSSLLHTSSSESLMWSSS